MITNIHDDRGLSTGFIDQVKRQIGRHYRLVDRQDYLPFKETLAAKLPIRRHAEGATRVTVTLYEKR